MINKKNIMPFLPYIIFLVIMLIWHATINVSGDDIYFKNYFDFLFSFDSNNFILYRLRKWSWRLIIESILPILCTWPILWIISDSILTTLLAFLIPRLTIKNFNLMDDSKKIKYSLLSILLVVIFIYSDFGAIKSAGFIATTVNYTWPFIFAVLHLYIFKEYFYDKKEIEPLKKYLFGIISILALIFATNMEIILLSLILCYSIFILYKAFTGDKSFFNNLLEFFKTNKILIVYLIIILLMLIFFIKCPGNKARFIEETGNWGDYSVLRFRNKFDLSFTSIYCMLITTVDLIFCLYFLALNTLASRFTKNKLLKVIILIPPIALAVFYLILILQGGYNRFLFVYLIQTFKPYGLFSYISLKTMNIASFYIYMIISILISLYLIYKHDKKLGLTIFSLLLVAFASQFVIGFAPSCLIWTYPLKAYPGRWWIIFNGIQMFSLMILLLELKKNRNNNKTLKNEIPTN